MNLIEGTIENSMDVLKYKLDEIIEKEGIDSNSALCLSQILDCIIVETQKSLLKNV